MNQRVAILKKGAMTAFSLAACLAGSLTVHSSPAEAFSVVFRERRGALWLYDLVVAPNESFSGNQQLSFSKMSGVQGQFAGVSPAGTPADFSAGDYFDSAGFTETTANWNSRTAFGSNPGEANGGSIGTFFIIGPSEDAPANTDGGWSFAGQSGTVTVPTVAVPEPLTILGSGVALGFGGLLAKEYGKIKRKQDED